MSYLMESDAESRRLEAKTDAARVRARLQTVGLMEGARALDAGAGTGAIARVMAGMVGASGRVVALDASRERLAHGRKLATNLANLEFVCGDLYAPPLAPGGFDFVWCEFVFEYLRDPDAVLKNLAALVRPGGKLVVGDLDGNGIFHDPVSPAFAARLETFQSALGGSFDPHAGRHLFHRFRRLGLDGMQVHVTPYHLYPGRISKEERANWETKFATLAPRGAAAFGSAAAYREFVSEYLAHLDDPDTLTYSVLFLVEWKKP